MVGWITPHIFIACLFDEHRSGGMPDDTTVVVMHVVGRDADDVMDSTNM
jgi:predicted esterase